LNNNADNDKLLEKFIGTANSIKKQFKGKFGDNWTDPAEEKIDNNSNVQEEADEIEAWTKLSQEMTKYYLRSREIGKFEWAINFGIQSKSKFEW